MTRYEKFERLMVNCGALISFIILGVGLFYLIAGLSGASL